ncbi:MAG: DUF262 domain-containing protein [Deltaproteobacteria bacterium]|nr:DUF262 domain-containing protein [Deltaproteobacteria bacterium]
MQETKVQDETENELMPFRYAILSYGADYPVDSLVHRLEREVIFVPEFQRKYVWSLKQASRFIESLLLGLPVPGVFFAKEADTGKLLIIDGQQRLRTLQYFYDGLFMGKEFALKDVQVRYEGLSFKKLGIEDQLRLNDSVIHATIIKQEEPSDDQSSVYHIFERLNTGGTLLQPQEIRACIFHGPFAELLKEFNDCPDWRTIYGPPSKRLKDQELILRFLALFFDKKKYSRPMKEFLNTFMGSNKMLQKVSRKSLTEAFLPTVRLIAATLSQRAFRPERALNAAVLDSVMVGIARRLQRSSIKDEKKIIPVYESLLGAKEYMSAVRAGTSDEPNVTLRIDKAVKAFAELR